MRRILDYIQRSYTEAGITQELLAKMMGCSQAHVSRLMDGKNRWNDVMIEQFCDAMGISLPQLFQAAGYLARHDPQAHADLDRIFEEGDPQKTDAIKKVIAVLTGHSPAEA